ncbi:MAG: menaquinone biosynthetic enzyme MqnA/MqnD family protein [Phycisphaerales bacterium]
MPQIARRSEPDVIRLGYVKYLNTLPLVEGLGACRDVSLHAAVPSHLIDMLEADEIDIGLVSLIDAARSRTELALLPVGMIGCDGPTLTVRLFSSTPIDRIRVVHADADSHTSTCLVSVLLHAMHGVRVTVVPFDARERMPLGPEGRLNGEGESATAEAPEATLLIGDKVVTDAPSSEKYPYQLDLGEAWKRLTGLPFVYAVWMCTRERAHEERVRLAAALLERQRLHNSTRLDWIVSTRAAERAWPDDLARVYVGSLLRYEVDDAARESAERFLAMSAQLGLCPAPPTGGASLNWAR